MTEFSCAAKIVTGSNALSVLGGLQADRIMVVTDKYFSQNGTAEKIGVMIPHANVRIFDQVQPDPSAELIAEGAAVCTEFCPQYLIALGGGSPMDCAKAIGAAVDCPPKLIAIPTTSGSGSEVTSYAVVTHRGVKYPLTDPDMRPEMAILDAALLQNLPSALIADTGMDLIAHAVEALAAKNRNTFTDALALHALSLAAEHLAASFGGEREHRGTIHEAACMAGLAFDNAGLGICHAMAHAMGARLHLPHGRLCAMLLPGTVAIHAKAAEAGYKMAAKAFGASASTGQMAARNLSAAIVRLRSKLQMPGTLAQAGVTAAQLRPIRREILQAALADACCKTNPIPVTEALLDRLLRTVEQ